MSGTSLDGIDVALVTTDGESRVERGPARTYAYTPEQRQSLAAALREALQLKTRDERPLALAEVERALTEWHAVAVKRHLEEFSLRRSEIDVIGFHGQTVLHRPDRRLTVQLGDGQLLAERTGIPVVFDMRAADVAAGGQGAPLVPVYHRALAASIPERPVAFVNIGGVANVTWIGRDGDLLAFDTGPGNALIDDWALRHTGQATDFGGSLALRGRVDESVVAQFLGDSYFEETPPKSLDRNSFAGIDLAGLAPEDGAATLVAVTARTVALAADWFPEPPALWIICGGGRKNPAVMTGLRERLPRVLSAEEAAFDGDAIEAEAWAYLAVRCLRHLPISFPGTTRAPTPLTGGKLVRPAGAGRLQADSTSPRI
ncbi:MAG: anhydro-N-acetylmuramic acid kinase [Rhizobiales bacterium]|nr:anhydro-N-acetylmuramic acid kinase [Hyphomicrobiales bacterium]